MSFVEGVSEQEKNDVLYSIQLAQRGASGTYDRFTQTQFWYQKYVEILENLGWATEQFAFTRFDQTEGEFRMDQAALAIITAIATQNQLAVLQESVAALSKLAEDDGTIQLFDFHSSMEGSGNFQLGAVQRTPNGALIHGGRCVLLPQRRRAETVSLLQVGRSAGELLDLGAAHDAQH